MIEGGRLPYVLVMTGFTFRWELCLSMIGIGCLVVIVGVTSKTKVGSIVVIAVVANITITGYRSMCPNQWIEIIK